MKLMTGLFLRLSQWEDSLKMGLELDETDFTVLQGEFSQQN
jgi:hypothetical protein